MAPEFLQEALQIITESNNPKVSFNVPINGSYSRTHAIIIHECNASLIEKLVKKNYMLFMKAEGLIIDRVS